MTMKVGLNRFFASIPAHHLQQDLSETEAKKPEPLQPRRLVEDLRESGRNPDIIDAIYLPITTCL